MKENTPVLESYNSSRSAVCEVISLGPQPCEMYMSISPCEILQLSITVIYYCWSTLVFWRLEDHIHRCWMHLVAYVQSHCIDLSVGWFYPCKIRVKSRLIARTRYAAHVEGWRVHGISADPSHWFDVHAYTDQSDMQLAREDPAIKGTCWVGLILWLACFGLYCDFWKYGIETLPIMRRQQILSFPRRLHAYDSEQLLSCVTTTVLALYIQYSTWQAMPIHWRVIRK